MGFLVDINTLRSFLLFLVFLLRINRFGEHSKEVGLSRYFFLQKQMPNKLNRIPQQLSISKIKVLNLDETVHSSFD